MARIAFAWEIGARRGHTGPMMAVAAGLASRHHVVHAFLREPEGVSDMAGADALRIFPAPRWIGEVVVPAGLNLGEILLNFGFHAPEALAQLVEAWRTRLAGADLLVSNVAPAAIVAAQTLGLPCLEMSQGFHIPPVSFPAAPFRDWDVAPRPRLEAADGRVLESINAVRSRYGVPSLATIGALFADHLMLLTYPELEMYPERGPSEYFGIMPSASQQLRDWPTGAPRVLAYLYSDYPHLHALLAAIARHAGAAVVICPGIDDALREHQGRDHVMVTGTLLDFLRMAEGADLVVCHASHQTTAEALLTGRPTLLLPTQVEQFLTTRRVVRYGAGLGIALDADRPDFDRALTSLLETPTYAARAREFAARYGGHDRASALDTILERCERAVRNTRIGHRRHQIHILSSFKNAHGGGERHALALYDLLAKAADVRLWSIDEPDADYGDHTITHVDQGLECFPSGGTLIVVGPYVPLRDWLRRAWFDRSILIYNALPEAERRLESFKKLQSVSGGTEIVYASPAVAREISIPGEVHVSPIDTSRFVPGTVEPARRFTIGRLSRDISLKHHAADPALYRDLAADGMRVRIMGGTCLGIQPSDSSGIEVLRAGAEPAPDFLHSLDCFIYRISEALTETFGRVIFEAMACGLPVVCERRGGYAAWIEHGRNGFLFDTRREALEIIGRLRDDPALRTRVGRSARATVETMYSESALDSMRAYYLGKDR